MNKNGMLTWSFTRKKKESRFWMWKSNTKFWHCREPKHWMSEGNMCFTCILQCLSNYLSHGEHTSSSVLTIAWKDSVKTTLGWYLTRLRVLAWLCRKEIATAVVYVWLMKGIFTLNPSAAKDFLPFTFPWQGLFNPSAGFVIPKRGSVFPITGYYFPKWSSFNTRRDLSFAKWLEMALIKVNLYPLRRLAVAKYCSMQILSAPSTLLFNFDASFEAFHLAGLKYTSKAVAYWENTS